jgi:hypothetical protein
MKDCAVALCTLLLCVTAATAAAGPTYVATVLHPIEHTNSAFYGADGKLQVGAVHDDRMQSRAVLWNAAAGNVVDLHPSRYSSSVATDVYGNSQVGYGIDSDKARQYALLWSGTADSVVDLHPSGYYSSEAWAVAGGVQVGAGYAAAASYQHALLWYGTAASVVDLHPPGYYRSRAWGAWGNSQVGAGASVGNPNDRALLWHGTADSVISLHPASMRSSVANDVWGDVQVGMAATPSPGSVVRAYRWNGTAESAVDINPTGMVHSFALAISSAGIVGFGVSATTSTYNDLTYPDQHALVWPVGTDGAVDLQPAMLATGLDADWSIATAIDEEGNVFGYAQSFPGAVRAIKWTLVPEPSSSSLFSSIVHLALARALAKRGRKLG